MAKVRLAIFQKDLSAGGIQRALVNLLNNLDYKQYEVDLYLWGDDDFFDIDHKNVNIIYQKKPNFVKDNLSKLLPFRLQKSFFRNRIHRFYDVAIDFSSYANYCALSALKVPAHRRLIWVHNDVAANLEAERKYRILWRAFKNKFRYFDHVVAVSDWAKRSFQSVTKLPAERILVVSNYVDTTEIAKLAKAKIAGFDKSKINLLAVGRAEYQKGFDILLKNFRTALNKNPKLRLFIAGGGRDLGQLEALAKDLDIKEEVKFLGAQKNPYKYLAAADAFVSAARFEGQGVAILEARALGLPVILSRNLQKTILRDQPPYDFIDQMAKLKRQPHHADKLADYNKQVLVDFAAAVAYRPRVILTASTGGHLAELDQLAPLRTAYDCLLVTELDDTTKQRAERTKYLTRDVNRNLIVKVAINLANLRRAVKIVREFRPDFVVSTGASSAALVCWAAKLFANTKVIFVETAASVNQKSSAGRLTHPIADQFIVQHEQLRRYDPKAIYGGSIFNIKPTRTASTGQTILVLFGTQKNPFQRLATAVENLDVPEKIIVQNGHTPLHNQRIETHQFVNQAKYQQLNKQAKIIITHAGVGSIFQALALGKPVIVVPRLKKHGEHADDHQLAMARDLAQRGYVLLVENLSDLAATVARARNFKPARIALDNSKMLKLIEEFIDEH
jgi:glycosyltransferase involved in cell wall biosynthesis/UDP-N-acetylglucosamine transferase subunit ALG13